MLQDTPISPSVALAQEQLDDTPRALSDALIQRLAGMDMSAKDAMVHGFTVYGTESRDEIASESGNDIAVDSDIEDFPDDVEDSIDNDAEDIAGDIGVNSSDAMVTSGDAKW
ncbi:hypothetical protein FBU30_000848, partial [Linnemannia zychae]